RAGGRRGVPGGRRGLLRARRSAGGGPADGCGGQPGDGADRGRTAAHAPDHAGPAGRPRGARACRRLPRDGARFGAAVGAAALRFQDQAGYAATVLGGAQVAHPVAIAPAWPADVTTSSVILAVCSARAGRSTIMSPGSSGLACLGGALALIVR